jgi:hypothetical protein
MRKAFQRKTLEAAADLQASTSPEQVLLNARRQLPAYPGADGEEEAAEEMNRNAEPASAPDEVEPGPVFDSVEAPPPTFYSGDANPEARTDDANEVEVRHSGPKGKRR